MPQSLEERTDRFARIFPHRVEKLVKSFDLLGNCTSKSSYAWDDQLVRKVWVHILVAVTETAKSYGLSVEFTVDGLESASLYDTAAIAGYLGEDAIRPSKVPKAGKGKKTKPQNKPLF